MSLPESPSQPGIWYLHVMNVMLHILVCTYSSPSVYIKVVKFFFYSKVFFKYLHAYDAGALLKGAPTLKKVV